MADLFDLLPDGLLEVGPEGRVLRANLRAEELLGGDPSGWELTRLRRGSLWRRVDGGVANLEANEGEHSGLRLITLRDGGERRAELTALSSANERLLAVLEVMPTLVCVFERGPRPRIVQTNAALERLVVATAEHLRRDAAPFFDVVDPADRNWLRSGIARALDGEAVVGDVTLGGRLHEIVVEPLPGRASALLMGRNISQERQVLSLYQQAARRELDQLRLLASSLAHDLGNTLTVLGAAMDTIPDGMAHESMLRAERSLADAGHLVHDLLHLGHDGDDSVSPVEVGPIVRSVSQRIAELAPAGIQVRAEIVASAQVLISGSGLVRILTQLGANALRACGPTGEIVLRLDRADDTVVLEVEDDGAGIPRDLLKELFRPVGKEQPELGLPLVRGLVQAAGGEITASSSGDTGTCMRVTLPVAPVQATGPLPPQPADLPSKVLIVEDDEDVLASLQWLLTAKQVEVVSAAGGAEAVRFCEDPELGMVLLDLYMPGLSGLEVLALLVQKRPELPVVVMSGFARQEEIDQCMAQGAAAFVSKPFRLRELREAVASWRVRRPPTG